MKKKTIIISLIFLLSTTILYAKPKEICHSVQLSSFLNDISFQGNFDLIGQSYLQAPQGKNPFNITGLANLEIKYTKDDFTAKAKIRAQQDYHDFNIEDDNQQTDRSFIRVDELYAQYDFEDDQILFGKNIRFWGALEVRNITDNFNSDELRVDPFYKDKLGSWNASYSHFTENGELSIIVKLYEQSRQMSAFPYVYYYFPSTVQTPIGTAPLVYDNELLSQEGSTRPSVYLKYSASTDSDYPIDYSVIFENGYDSQRYYTQKFNIDSNSLSIQENAYLVNKFLTYNTMVVNATLIKLEAVYADVINNDKISDYIHLGLGVEHTMTQVYKEANLGLIAEYYSYTTLENDKYNDLKLFELFQNDLFIGTRYTLNDAQDSALIGGVIIDLDYDEQVYYIEYETRLADIIKVNFDYRYIQPSKDTATAFNLMGVHERLSLKLGYYF
ncbi:hypothetical protein JHD49_09100 [Sulfurimonas sp. SAG-AH-194-C21]|nr:hypothetical protein [Sulfurimonas sp. SAG-AH-194-C21]MDF1884094.1 hypothetical protein [Sulfurimonas sp. SAG-AH-194-C21]